jgi:hypothetical protein
VPAANAASLPGVPANDLSMTPLRMAADALLVYRQHQCTYKVSIKQHQFLSILLLMSNLLLSQ